MINFILTLHKYTKKGQSPKNDASLFTLMIYHRLSLPLVENHTVP